MIRPTPRRLGCLAFVVAALSVWVGRLWLAGGAMPPQPIEAFWPDHWSGAVRVRHPASTWSAHWLMRPNVAPETALRQTLEAAGAWSDFEADYGAAGGALRLALYQKALFHTLGDEAWLLFGEWGNGGEAGLVLLVRSDSSVKNLVGPLMDLAWPKHRVRTSRYRGVRLYRYVDEDDPGHGFTLCRMGGWLCASLRQDGPGPLHALIDRLRGPGGAAPPVPRLWEKAPDDDGDATPWLAVAVDPATFCNHLRRFSLQRGRPFSEKHERQLGRWRLRLDGVERLSLTAAPERLADFSLRARGPRLARLSAALKTTTAPQVAPPLPTPARHAQTPDWREWGRIDLDATAAWTLLPVCEVSPAQALETVREHAIWAPGLAARIDRQFTGKADATRGRLGAAVGNAPEAVVPEIVHWSSPPPAAAGPTQYDTTVPGLPEATPADGATTHATRAHVAASPTSDTAAPRAWHALQSRLWAHTPSPPPAFMALDFGAMSDALDRTPPFLFSDDTQDDLRRGRDALRALDLALGGAALRLDLDADRLTVRLRTP